MPGLSPLPSESPSTQASGTEATPASWWLSHPDPPESFAETVCPPEAVPPQLSTPEKLNVAEDPSAPVESISASLPPAVEKGNLTKPVGEETSDGPLHRSPTQSEPIDQPKPRRRNLLIGVFAACAALVLLVISGWVVSRAVLSPPQESHENLASVDDGSTEPAGKPRPAPTAPETPKKETVPFELIAAPSPDKPLPAKLEIDAKAEVNLEAGENAILTVQVHRQAYQGPVTVQLEGLPAQVTAKPVVIAANQKTARIELTVPRTAPEANREARVLALGGNLKANRPLQIKLASFVPFHLLPIADVTLRPGQPKEITVQVRRKDEKGLIHVSLEGNLGAVSANSGAIPSGKDKVTLELTPRGAARRFSRQVPFLPSLPDLHERCGFGLTWGISRWKRSLLSVSGPVSSANFADTPTRS